MDIVYLAAAIVAALTLPRPRALIVAVGAWAFCVAFVGWGPAKSDGVHVASAGFWVPWFVVLGIGLLIAAGVSTLRARRATTRG
jgi:hypothetical protein